MKFDFLKGILLLLALVIIGSWITKPDFAVKNPGVASFLGLTSSSSGTANTQQGNKAKTTSPTNNQTGARDIKIIGASVSFDGSYNQVVLYVGKNSAKVNLANYFLKTTNGTYNLPVVTVGAGDYILLTSNTSPNGLNAKKISSNHYEIFLSQKFLSSNNETAELYSSAGVLVSRYVYGSAALF